MQWIHTTLHMYLYIGNSKDVENVFLQHFSMPEGSVGRASRLRTVCASGAPTSPACGRPEHGYTEGGRGGGGGV